MAEIRINPLNISVRTRKGENVRDALYRAGVELESPCNGNGLCGKCLVCVDHPEKIPETPHREITEDQAAEGIRLACRLVPQADMTLRLLSEYSRDEHRILEGDQDPAFSEWEESASEAGSAKRHLSESDSRMQNRPAVVLDVSGGKCTCRYDGGAPEPIHPWKANADAKGLAIDLGTTTLVVTLIDLLTGKELATTSSLNPQIRFGHDVVRRIQHGSAPEGRAELFESVRDGLNRLIEQACEDSGADPREVLDVVIGGNTTMLQLAASVNPEPLGQVPFTVDLEGGRPYPAAKFGFAVHPAARVYVPPILHAYVGADISAGLLVSGRFFASDGTMLFVDIGTNGEMGLSAGSQYLMTSTAAGPAFEGMGISSGMRARIGAVEAVTTDGKSLFQIHTIGDAPLEGICGSGIVDLTAALLRLGVLDITGRMRKPDQAGGLPEAVAARLSMINDVPAFHLGGDVYFTQEDVRQVQLAKSAIRAAIEILLAEAGISRDDLDRIVLAGGFGYSLRARNLEVIGLLPPGTADKVYFAGNTSRIGCVRMLRNVGYRRFLEEKMKRVSHVSIETRPDFMEQYVGAMEFPVSRRQDKRADSDNAKNAAESMSGPTVIIACRVMQHELEATRKQSGGAENSIEIRYMDQNLHRTPEKMPERIQAEIDAVADYAGRIVLGYGLCSNGIVGVTARKQEVCIPRVHDCIALLLGSRKAYFDAFRKRAGTYYLTPGWVAEEKDPLGMAENEYAPRMGREMAEWGIREELKHYTHIVLINTGTGDMERLRKRARANAEFLDKVYEEVEGRPDYFRKLLFGPYDTEAFVCLAPGQSARQKPFMRQSKSENKSS